MTWIRRYKNSLFPKFQLILILRFQVMHDYVCFIAPTDYCVSLVEETFCENCSNFTLKWLQPNSFGEMCFLEERYEKMQKKFKVWKFWECPLFKVREYTLTSNNQFLETDSSTSYWGQILDKDQTFLPMLLVWATILGIWISQKVQLYIQVNHSRCTFYRHLYVWTGHGNPDMKTYCGLWTWIRGQ